MKALWVYYQSSLLTWLKVNPLGPALTVVLTGLTFVFLLPQLTLLLVVSPRLILCEVLVGALVVPYAVYRVHGLSPRVLGAIWAGIYIVSFLRTPVSLRIMHPFAISAHMSSWFLIGFAVTAVYGLLFGSPAGRLQDAALPSAEVTSPSSADRAS